MSRGTTWLAAMVLVATTAATAASAFNCTRTPALGPSVFWPQRDVEVRPVGGGFEVPAGALVGVLERGAASWTAADCSDLTVAVGEPSLLRVIGFNWHAGSGSPLNENIVVFRNDTQGDEVDRWVHTLGALAITTVTFDATSGRLLDADIEINDRSFTFTTCDPEDAGCEVVFDLENTLTHELGHVVGLDHPPNDAPDAFAATMFASASETDTEKRTLADDDIAGLCTIYPGDSDVAGECYGVGRPARSSIVFEQTLCASGTTADRFAPVLGLGLLLALLQVRGRRPTLM